MLTVYSVNIVSSFLSECMRGAHLSSADSLGFEPAGVCIAESVTYDQA